MGDGGDLPFKMKRRIVGFLVDDIVVDAQQRTFELHGVKIYAIPDFVHRDGDTWHIHDWKSGRRSEQHLHQLKIYGLWAHIKHGVSADRIEVHAEYLLEDHTERVLLAEADLEQITETIGASVSEMTEYLERFDRKANQPVAREEWELADDPRTCARCPFYELCEPELTER